MRMLEVPQVFTPEMNMIYPPHQGNNPLIEKHCYNFFSQNLENINSDYIYLPIQWTAYHLLNGYGQNVQPLISYYSQVVEQLPNEKFFTVVQYDGGTLVELKNCRIFAASGSFSSPIGENSVYEPIPLLCDPHPLIENESKQYKVVFCGRRTHELREKMFDTLSNVEGYNLYDTSSAAISQEDVDTFRTLLSDSIFGLCPRGYGPASFRFYETIQMGCIPIYISDKFWLPFREYINWNKLCLMISPDQIHHIPAKVDQLIESGEYKDMLEYGQYCYNNYLSWDGAVNTIGKIISK
jgi:hypothetical protein